MHWGRSNFISIKTTVNQSDPRPFCVFQRQLKHYPMQNTVINFHVSCGINYIIVLFMGDTNPHTTPHMKFLAAQNLIFGSNRKNLKLNDMKILQLQPLYCTHGFTPCVDQFKKYMPYTGFEKPEFIDRVYINLAYQCKRSWYTFSESWYYHKRSKRCVATRIYT